MDRENIAKVKAIIKQIVFSITLLLLAALVFTVIWGLLVHNFSDEGSVEFVLFLILSFIIVFGYPIVFFAYSFFTNLNTGFKNKVISLLISIISSLFYPIVFLIYVFFTYGSNEYFGEGYYNLQEGFWFFALLVNVIEFIYTLGIILGLIIAFNVISKKDRSVLKNG